MNYIIIKAIGEHLVSLGIQAEFNKGITHDSNPYLRIESSNHTYYLILDGPNLAVKDYHSNVQDNIATWTTIPIPLNDPEMLTKLQERLKRNP